MSAPDVASVSALLTFSLKKETQGVEAVATGARRDQWVMKESKRMLVNLQVLLILLSSMTGISHVGGRRLSVVAIAAMSVSRVSV